MDPQLFYHKTLADRCKIWLSHSILSMVGTGRGLASQSLSQSAPSSVSKVFTFWALITAAVFVVYTLGYFSTEALPGNPEAPLGWWGWYDQSNYIASARSFADGTWRDVQYLYPPLYPWLGSLFINAWPAHPFFLIDFAGLALCVGALLIIGRLYFGWAAAGLATVASFALFPAITFRQWEIPWTTSLSSGLGAVLLLVFCRFSKHRWVMSSAADWILIGIISISFGAVAAVRPLDVVVWLPVALGFYVGIALRNANPWRSDFRIGKTLLLATIVIAAGLFVPLLYLAFNVITSGTLAGTYIIRASANGYQIHGFIRKFISLIFDSSTIYVERNQALADQFGPIYLAFPLLVYYIIRGPLLLRMLCVTIALQYMIYIPYADLLPNGMFRYSNVHYFTWTFPWLLMLCLGFLRSLATQGALRAPRRIGDLAMIIGCTVLCLLVTLRARPVGSATAAASSDHDVTVQLDGPQAVDFIDVVGTVGSWPDIYFGSNALKIDGQPYLMVAEFRMVPTDQGLRVILPRTVRARTFVLTLDPNIRIEPAILAARASSVSVSLLCRLRVICDTTPLAAPLPLITQSTTVDFADEQTSAPYLGDGWYPAEAWGRWSTAPRADVAFRVDHPKPVSISALVQPLLSSIRPRQIVTLTANACAIGETSFAVPDDAASKTITAEIPASCIGADGGVDLAISTEDAPTPKTIGINDDGRTIGFGLKQLTIQ
jgi:hypothetical protein